MIFYSDAVQADGVMKDQSPRQAHTSLHTWLEYLKTGKGNLRDSE